MARAISDNSRLISITVTKTVKAMIEYAAKKENVNQAEYIRNVLNNHFHSIGLMEDMRDGLVERGANAMFTHASSGIQKLRKKILQERMEHARKHIPKQAPKQMPNAKSA